MKKIALVFLISVCMAGTASAQGGLVSVKSSNTVLVTANRLEKELKENEIIVFARIDYAESAELIGQTLAPTILVIFGSPAMGTPLIQRSRTIGIDLPLKALIWEDRAGQVWFTYNTPGYLTRRHGITEMGPLAEKMEKELADFATAATQPSHPVPETIGP